MITGAEYYIRPMRAADLPNVADVAASAFASGFADSWSYQLDKPRELSNFRYWWLYSLRQNIHGVGYHCWVLCKRLVPEAVDPKQSSNVGEKHEQIIGASVWARSGSSTTARAWQATSWYYALERNIWSWEHWVLTITGGYGAAYDQLVDNAYDVICTNTVQKWKKLIPERWHLLQIMIDPQFQGRGLAGMLINWGMKQAENEGIPVTLFAGSDFALSLYKKKKFFVLDWPNRERKFLTDGSILPFMAWEPERPDPAFGSVRGLVSKQ